VPNYRLLYIRPRSTSNWQSNHLREKEQAISELVEQVRVISINGENDALTIDVEFVQNFDYFMKIMKLINDEFLIREYRLTKETALEGSLLFSPDSKRGYHLVADP
jgi:hypothetical protein